MTATNIFETGVEIGKLPVAIRSESPEFARLLESRYANFLCRPENATIQFYVAVTPPSPITNAEQLEVRQVAGNWLMRRGDFSTEWDPRTERGYIRQSANPYSIDSVLRILHTLHLAKNGGFLVHAASAVRNGKAFLFAGVSGAGKTTISRLAPADAVLLSDEISYVQKQGDTFHAFGTPFTGELAKSGENVSAPVAVLYLLLKGVENRIEPVAQAAASCALLSNILFFANDAELVKSVFHSACEFVARVPVCNLVFVADSRIWEMIL
jgi:hypothetical protein